MTTKLTYKERTALQAASDYLFGREKVLTIGRSCEWQIELVGRILKPKKKSLLTVLADAARLENEREVLTTLYTLEPCDDYIGEPIEIKNPKQYAEFFDISEEEAKELLK